MSYEPQIHDDALRAVQNHAFESLSRMNRDMGFLERAKQAASELLAARKEIGKLRKLLRRARPRLRKLIEHSDLLSKVEVDPEKHWTASRRLVAELDALFSDEPRGDLTQDLDNMTISAHPPQERFIMVFSDETAEDRTREDMDGLVDRLREAAAPAGFDIQMWGPEPLVANALNAHARSVLTMPDFDEEDACSIGMVAAELFPGGKAGA